MTPDEYCQEKAAASGSSFYASFRFLSPEQRTAMTALYAFCREVDDVVDECRDPTLAAAKLNWWRGEVHQIWHGKPSHPVAQALQAVVARLPLPQALFEEILDGMAMDLHQVRYPDFAALSLYCHRVAGVVGQLSARIFGHSDPRTLDYAHELGLAFQLTNIIRDVGEDARRGRIYLPQDELAHYGVQEQDLLAGRHSPAFTQLMTFQLDRAEQTYASALALLPQADRKTQRPGLLMAAVYRTLLAEIRRDGCRVLQFRIALPTWRKLWIVWKTWLTT